MSLAALRLPTADVLLWLVVGSLLVLLLVGLAGFTWNTLAKARRLRNRHRPNPLLALSMAEFNRKGRRP